MTSTNHTTLPPLPPNAAPPLKDLPPLSPGTPPESNPLSIEVTSIESYSPSVGASLPPEEHERLLGLIAEKELATDQRPPDPVPADSASSSTDDPDVVLAQLLSMGFELDLCEVAIAESVADGGHAMLLERAITWAIARQGGEAEVRSVTCKPEECWGSSVRVLWVRSRGGREGAGGEWWHSPRNSSSSRPTLPPGPDARPARGILKTSSPPPQRAGTGIFKREWFTKQMDQAASSLGLAFGKSASARPASNPYPRPTLDTSAKASGSGASPSSTGSGEASTSPPASPRSPFMITDPSGSLESLNSLSMAPGASTIKPSLSFSSLSKRVRFSFPDISIDPEPDFTPDPEDAEGTRAPGASPPGTPPGEEVDSPEGSSQDLLSEFRRDQKSRAEVAAGRVIEENSRSRSPPELTVSDLLDYYLTTCSRREEQPIEKLTSQLQNAIRSKLPFVKIDLIGELILEVPLPCARISRDLNRRLRSPHLAFAGITIDRRNVGSLADLLIIDFGLKYLNLENCGLEDEVGIVPVLKIILHAVLSCDSLPWLSVANNRKIRMNGMKYMAVYIKKSISLKYLDLSGLSFDKRGLAYLSYALAQGSQVPPCGATLEVLKMEKCRLNAGLLEIIAPGIVKSRVTNLSLRNNKMSADCGRPIAEMITIEMPSSRYPGIARGLLTLDLRGNELRHGTAPIAEALATNDCLVELTLRDNKIDPVSLITLANALRLNQTLKVLDLSGNALCAINNLNGILSLKDALAANRSLTELSLANTNLMSEAAIALAEAIPLTTVLQRLDVTCNPMDIAGAMALSVSLRMNRSITSLEVAPMLEKSRGKGHDDADIARLLNDIVIYCQCNAEILRAKAEDARGTIKSSAPIDAAEIIPGATVRHPRSPLPPSPSMSSAALDTDRLRMDIAAAMETASVLDEMVSAKIGKGKGVAGQGGIERSVSSEDLLEQLCAETKGFQRKLQGIVSGDNPLEEDMMSTILSVNDRLETSLQGYEAIRKAVKAEKPRDVSPARKTSELAGSPNSTASSPTKSPTKSAASPLRTSPVRNPTPSPLSISETTTWTPRASDPTVSSPTVATPKEAAGPSIPAPTSAPAPPHPQALAKRSLGSLSSLDLLDLESDISVGEMTQGVASDDFMAELDDQVRRFVERFVEPLGLPQHLGARYLLMNRARPLVHPPDALSYSIR
ncbi:hypothetical protein BDK51DRAFT_49524 [Blyttiomyces helicus]|uniref:GAT domain-containing protein n=1 Tax=Blyttiomyces helicus TaxID=388810 RepID=A0A4P9WIJ5_9FUNG|nr:hypothetical protein BDK51DRAFT_49524 [Blyttiomyces helicus]|eukprot:RKO92691.1 hypothetical protein BDK51DRAFT_49524 [Blyttiomyces helicus]